MLEAVIDSWAMTGKGGAIRKSTGPSLSCVSKMWFKAGTNYSVLAGNSVFNDK